MKLVTRFLFKGEEHHLYRLRGNEDNAMGDDQIDLPPLLLHSIEEDLISGYQVVGPHAEEINVDSQVLLPPPKCRECDEKTLTVHQFLENGCCEECSKKEGDRAGRVAGCCVCDQGDAEWNEWQYYYRSGEICPVCPPDSRNDIEFGDGPEEAKCEECNAAFGSAPVFMLGERHVCSGCLEGEAEEPPTKRLRVEEAKCSCGENLSPHPVISTEGEIICWNCWEPDPDSHDYGGVFFPSLEEMSKIYYGWEP